MEKSGKTTIEKTTIDQTLVGKTMVGSHSGQRAQSSILFCFERADRLTAESLFEMWQSERRKSFRIERQKTVKNS